MASHSFTDDTTTGEIPMMNEDTGYIPEDTRARPDAEAIVEQLSAQAMKFRILCQGELERAKQDLEFWSRQHDIVTSFLVKDQLSGPISGPGHPDMPVASRMRRTLEND